MPGPLSPSSPVVRADGVAYALGSERRFPALLPPSRDACFRLQRITFLGMRKSYAPDGASRGIRFVSLHNFTSFRLRHVTGKCDIQRKNISAEEGFLSQ